MAGQQDPPAEPVPAGAEADGSGGVQPAGVHCAGTVPLARSALLGGNLSRVYFWGIAMVYWLVPCRRCAPPADYLPVVLSLEEGCCLSGVPCGVHAAPEDVWVPCGARAAPLNMEGCVVSCLFWHCPGKIAWLGSSQVHCQASGGMSACQLHIVILLQGILARRRCQCVSE